MSQIFDGLQRSEAERNGTDVTAFPGVTELLRQSEREAASRWESGARPEQLAAAKGEEPLVSVVSNEVPPLQKTSEASAAFESLRSEKLPDPFGEFQSLQVSLAPQSRLACLTDSGSPAAEAFRLLGFRLRDLGRIRKLKTILITSTIPQEGKSMVAANLACTLAQSTQQRILLLEGDLRRPSLSKMFGLGRNQGLSEYMQGERSLTASIYRLDGQRLWFFPSGTARSNALDLLQVGKVSTLMDQLTAWFDWIIIDSPPALPLADTSVWMRLADGILLIVRQGTTEKKQLQRGLEALESKKLLGAVVNSSKHSSDYYSYCSPGASQLTDSSNRAD